MTPSLSEGSRATPLPAGRGEARRDLVVPAGSAGEAGAAVRGYRRGRLGLDRPLTLGCRLVASTTRSSRPSPRKRGEGISAVIALLVCLIAGPALAAGGHGEQADPAKEAAMRALAIRDGAKDVPAQDFVKEAPKAGYCASIADAAADARFAWQKEQLAVLEREVEARIARLEEKRAEYETWLKRREAFLAKADEGVVALYAKMRPDAAAPQLATMPEDAAAAILTKLNARAASAILAEMEAARAAGLARRMSDLGRRKDEKKDERS